MQTLVQNMPNSYGYIKCGEILQSKQSYHDPYILRCIQCKENYLLLESFILHFDDECKVATDLRKKRIHAAKMQQEEDDDETDDDDEEEIFEEEIPEEQNSPVKTQTSNDMQMVDPLNVGKNNSSVRTTIIKEEPGIQEAKGFDIKISEAYQIQDEDGDITANSQYDNESEEDEDIEEVENPNESHVRKKAKFKQGTDSPSTSKVRINKNEHDDVDLLIRMSEKPKHSKGTQGKGSSRIEQFMEQDIVSMLQSGTGFEMNFHTATDNAKRDPQMAHNNQMFGRPFDPNDIASMLQSPTGYQMDFHGQPDHLAIDQLYGRHFKGDIMIDIGNNIYCRKRVLDMALGSSHKATHVARKLLEGVFKMETLLICTLTGIAPRAQGRERMCQEVVQLDYKARSSIVDFSIGVGEKKGWVVQSAKLIERAMSQRIGEIKRLKQHYNNIHLRT